MTQDLIAERAPIVSAAARDACVRLDTPRAIYALTEAVLLVAIAVGALDCAYRTVHELERGHG